MQRRALLRLLPVALLGGCAGAPADGSTRTETGSPTPEPTESPTATPTTTPGAAYDVRVALVRRYDPGTNAGMPSPVTGEQVNRTLERDPDLTDRLRAEFDPDDRFTLYRRVRQYQQVSVERRADGSWSFRLSDASGCFVGEAAGVYDDGTVRNVTWENETVPC